MTKKLLLVLVIAGLLATAPAMAQQTGSVSGRVTSPDGEPLPGVTVEARSNVLPQPRVVVTSANGSYRLRALPPGQYDLTFSLEGMQSVSQRLSVRLQQDTPVDVTLGQQTFEEEIQVVGEAPLIDRSSAEIKTVISNQELSRLPVGQEYRDVVKLVPGVQYTEDSVRGPSAGGSGQDNIYRFDGVDVTLPLFGTLSAEPSSHDIDQVSTSKGGAKATDFNRSGGFSINTVSKSGTNEYHGELKYQIQTDSMTGSRDVETASEFEEEQDWAVANFGGPLVRENLFFYGSYYQPTISRTDRSNLYGEVPDFDSTRDEFFGKLTWTPTGSVLLHGSYRDSDREIEGAARGETLANPVIGEQAAGSTSEGIEATLEVAIAEGSWVPTGNSLVSFKYTDFTNNNLSRPDTIFNFPIATDGSVGLDVNNLDQMGLLNVPEPQAGDAGFNAFIAPLIERYGFLEDGVRTGGGVVGADNEINLQDFFREGYEVGYDHMLDLGPTTHELHVGYQWSENREELARFSNGWGSITVEGGAQCLPADGSFPSVLPRCDSEDGAGGTPVFYTTRFQQMTLGEGIVTRIDSEFESQSIELNDTIRWNDWTFNAGVLLSNDTYFGQGLRPNAANPLTGLEADPGHEYEMYDIDFEDMIQPRLGAVWAYNGRDTVYANYARYHPAASSLPRAASWDRNLAAEIRAFFDANGNLIDSSPIASSSGKLFDDDLDPRAIDEYMLGTSKQFPNRWAIRTFGRYRDGSHFWEDTGNLHRVTGTTPPPGVPQEPYIPDHTERIAEIGSGSSYVIAELDGAFTKYYEASVETDWRGDKTYFKGSYTWSHYYGNFDQDNTTTTNDENIFIGSSFLADGTGRQIWDNKYGDLRGDRRHQLKLYGSYNLNWDASLGAFAIYQDGQPWEIWDIQAYFPGSTSCCDTSRNAEAAGSRRTDDHYQLDLNYTQNFRFGGRYNVQLATDLFNVFDKQTGYNIQNKRTESTDTPFGEPRSFYRPRRLQVAVRFQF